MPTISALSLTPIKIFPPFVFAKAIAVFTRSFFVFSSLTFSLNSTNSFSPPIIRA